MLKSILIVAIGVFVVIASSIVWLILKYTMGIRASEEDEDLGLDSAELGLEAGGLDRLIQAGYRLLDLVTFFTTTGGHTVQAWTVPSGTPAPRAAGTIHGDMERGFIRAEVVAFDDLAEDGSMAHAREQGHLRLEGRDYLVQDGDVIHFRFAV